jgi:hypothetical protein
MASSPAKIACGAGERYRARNHHLCKPCNCKFAANVDLRTDSTITGAARKAPAQESDNVIAIWIKSKHLFVSLDRLGKKIK